MEAITHNLQNPDWWFTGLFFVLVAVLVNQLVSKWLPAINNYLAKNVPRLFRGYRRKRHLSQHKKIKSIRFDDTLVAGEITKNHIYFGTVILLSVICMLTSIVLTTAIINIEKPVSRLDRHLLLLPGLFIMTPMYVMQLYWVGHSQFLKRLLKARSRIRFT